MPRPHLPSTGLRIAYVSLHTSPLASPGQADAGGMNVVELHQALALAERGVEVDLLTRRSEPDPPDVEDVAPGVRLHRLPAGPPTPLTKAETDDTIEPFREQLAAFVDRQRPDVLHSHHWFSGVAALPVGRGAGVPHVQSFHSVAAPAGSGSFAAGEPAESPRRIVGERTVADGSDLVVTVSEAEASTVRARYDVAADRLRVVRPGVDTDAFRPLAPGERPDRPPYLLFAARLQPLKAPDLALQTLALLPQPRPDLVLAGAASADFAAYTAELTALAETLGVRQQVTFAGSQSRAELATLMRGAAVFLLPSWSETFGLVALESAASGVPAIAWQGAGGVAEAIVDAGIVLADRDPAAWAGAVAALLADETRRRELGQRARAWAEQHTWRRVAEDLLEVYAELL
ncbi:glycosyltransferase [Parenemella sanctibonifatiensis]|uniref:Glycosyl transferase n=1 Tax=Parenemella sanctibonifatiensis TaxID=2016505 RepID=A0A255E7Y5_9ACTN|nr:glycosyltransferase [Parenemella sanctibonifatiensis]OYN87654.1 glycosyl transferase [Parenemella sanctibonifatiensis]